MNAGKAAVHTTAGGIHPRYTLPITLDVGCNRKSIREDPFYIGLRQVHICCTLSSACDVVSRCAERLVYSVGLI